MQLDQSVRKVYKGLQVRPVHKVCLEKTEQPGHKVFKVSKVLLVQRDLQVNKVYQGQQVRLGLSVHKVFKALLVLQEPLV